MKKSVIWLICGIVIGILVSVAASWIWCCGKQCGPNMERVQVNVLDSSSMASVSKISVDTANAYFNCYMKTFRTVDTLKGFNLNRDVLRALNLIAANPDIKSFRVYMGIFGDPVDVGIVVGVNSAGGDDTTNIYTTQGAVGPCPDVCDDESPITKPKE